MRPTSCSAVPRSLASAASAAAARSSIARNCKNKRELRQHTDIGTRHRFQEHSLTRITTPLNLRFFSLELLLHRVVAFDRSLLTQGARLRPAPVVCSKSHPMRPPINCDRSTFLHSSNVRNGAVQAILHGHRVAQQLLDLPLLLV
jgi:hypothetical protein